MNLEQLAQDKVKVRVTFASGNKKWGWIHLYDGRYWLTRGNRVGFSMDTAVKVEPISKVSARLAAPVLCGDCLYPVSEGCLCAVK